MIKHVPLLQKGFELNPAHSEEAGCFMMGELLGLVADDDERFQRLASGVLMGRDIGGQLYRDRHTKTIASACGKSPPLWDIGHGSRAIWGVQIAGSV